MKIEVTDTDISEATRNRRLSPVGYIAIYCCPISLAVNRALEEKGINNIRVNTGRLNFKWENKGGLGHGTLLRGPVHNKVEFVDGFDQYRDVEPFSFDLDDETISKLSYLDKVIEDSKSGAEYKYKQYTRINKR